MAMQHIGASTTKISFWPVQAGRRAIGRCWPLLRRIFMIPLAAGSAFAASPYANWPNGPPHSLNFIPLSVWWQYPNLAGHSGPYPTIAAAAAATKLNIFMGLHPWPEHFGRDLGELAAAKENNLYVIGGVNTPSGENTSAESVASVLALAKSLHAQHTVIGYNAGDEPQCPAKMASVPDVVARLQSYDPTRIVTYNQVAWMLNPQWLAPTCLVSSILALQATSIGSFDFYPLTNAWYRLPGSDFRSVPEDSLYMQGLATTALIHNGRPGQPMWVFVESGGDNAGFSGQNNVFSANLKQGAKILTNTSKWSSFTDSWIGLTVSGPGVRKNSQIVSVLSATRAVMSLPADQTNSGAAITVTGGAGTGTDCVASVNLCVVNGNEYRATPAQVNSEVWISLISGANGIEYFCHDATSASFCLGDVAGGAAAAATQANLTYINTTILKYAAVLNAPTLGRCSMEHMNFLTGVETTSTSCVHGILTMTTSNSAVPGLAMVKQRPTVTYLFAESDRRSPAGATFTYTLLGLPGATAKVVYDSNAKYDPAHSSTGATFTLNVAGQFSDNLGANHDDYQVKIYAIPNLLAAGN
jgi:hypothetical protein